jgi:putative ABC transport system permease protein
VIPLVRHAVFLALRHMAAGPVRTAVLVAGTTVALFLPAFTWRAVERIERRTLHRAETTPILLGRLGDELDLTLTSLYFRGGVRDTVPASLTEEAARYGTAVPVHVGHSADGTPIVGTSTEYFEMRGLRAAAGRLPATLGEVVAGARVAADAGLRVGDRVRSDLANLYDVAGAYPSLLHVAGILEPAATPDDDVLFADVKTAWMLDGALHGHEPLPEAAIAGPPEGEDGTVEASAALFLFQEVTPENRATFHLHGAEDDMPLSSVLVFPRDRRAHDLLLGDFALNESYRAVEPPIVVDGVLGIVLRVREGLSAYFALVALSTLGFFCLVLWLSLRLRQAEIDLMRRIGSSRLAIPAIVGAEIAAIVVAAIASTVVLTVLGLWIVDRFLY